MDLGPPELLIILVIVLVLFGGAKLPKLARSLGDASRELKKGLHSEGDDEAGATMREGTASSGTSASTLNGISASPDTVTISKAEYDAMVAGRPPETATKPS